MISGAPLSAAAGALAAILWLIGRWSPARLQADAEFDPSPLGQPRFAVAVTLLLLGLLVRAVAATRPLPEPVGRGWRGLVAVAVAWCGWTLLSALWTPDPGLAAHKALELTTLAVGMTGLAATIRHGDARACRAAMLITAVAGLLLLGGLGAVAVVGDRVAVLGGGANAFGRNQAVLVVLALGAWRTGAGRLWLVAAAIASVNVVLSGSRGALGAALLGVFTFSLLAGRGVGQRVATPLAVCATISLVFLLDVDRWAAASEMFRLRVFELTWEQGYTSGRERLYELAVELFLDAPLLGTGLAGFTALTGLSYPHNLVLEVVCETGLVGLILLLVAVGLWARLLFTLRPLDATTVATWVALVGAAQLSGDLYDSRGLAIWGLLAVAAGLGRAQSATVVAPAPLAATSAASH